LEDLKRLLSYLPQNNKETTHELPYELTDEIREQLETIIPDNPNKPYDMHQVVRELLTKTPFEIHKITREYNCRFYRLGGEYQVSLQINPCFLSRMFGCE
jgi:propionyl-CoA carboxylase beta chain